MIFYLYIKILQYFYMFFGYNYYEKLVLDKINFIYNELNSQYILKKIDIINVSNTEDYIYCNIKNKYCKNKYCKNKYCIKTLNDDYKCLCIKIYLIGNILKNNPKLTLKKDFIYLLYHNFKYAELNNITFYESFNHNYELKIKFNSIVFNYNKKYDLLYFIDYDNLYLKDIPNEDNINYGIKWCNKSKKFIFDYI